MKKREELGDMLLADGVISRSQLEEAVQNQVIYGGRLGTALLELGYIDEWTLSKYLSRQHQVPTVDWQDLVRIKTSVLKLVPRKLAVKLQAIPLKLEGNKLYVAMTDPSNLGALSELSFATGKAIVPLVLPEVRIFELLARYYNEGRELRYVNIAMMAKPRPKEERSQKPIAKIQPVKVSTAPLKEKMKFEQDEELLSEQEFEQLTTGYYQQKLKEEEPSVITEEPVLPSPIPETTPPPLKPIPPRAPLYKELAFGLWKIFIKLGIINFLPKDRLEFFLKSYVKSELIEELFPLKGLLEFLKKEASVPEEILEKLIEESEELGKNLGISILVPEGLKEEEPELFELEEIFELGEEAVSEEEVEYLPLPEAVSAEELEEVPGVPVEVLSFAQASSMLKSAQNRDDISRIVLGFALGFFKTAILFTVRERKLFGWDGIGPKLTRRLVNSIMIPLDSEPSLFKMVYDTSCHYLGPVPASPINIDFLEKLGGGKPNSVFLIPILWQQKVVYILYGDNGEGKDVPFDIGELLILAQKLPIAIEELIAKKKTEHLKR